MGLQRTVAASARTSPFGVDSFRSTISSFLTESRRSRSRHWLGGSALLRYNDQPSERGDAVERSGAEVDHAHRNQFEKQSLAYAMEQRPSRRTEASLQPKEVWAIRVRLQIKNSKRDLAIFSLAIDSKLRACDLVSLRIDDIAVGRHVRDRAPILQRKTGRPVQLEITEQTRASLQDWLNALPVDRGPYVFPSRVHSQPHVTARQYARIVHGWIEGAGMDSTAYGTHSMRRTKAVHIYRKTGNLRAVQMLLEMAT
ncbi:MAG: tyrosine-type recombinase/integrase [Xanthobacteraceae bacterium]